MLAELYLLRILHIVGGIFWVGGATVMAFFVFPSVQDAGPAGGQIMQGIAKRKYMVVVPISAIVTMLAGLRLLMIASRNFGPGYFATPMGKTYAISAAIVFLAFGHGMATARPMANRLGEIPKLMQEPNADKAALGAEAQKLQGKMGRNIKVTATLLLTAAVGMALARYM